MPIFLYFTFLYLLPFDLPTLCSSVYKDGKVCISILHPPGDDPMSGELASERWRPTQNVQSILLSVISMIADPNCSSPANVDAGVEYRDRVEKYNERVKGLAEKAKKACPKRVVIPHPDTDPEERARALKKFKLMAQLDSSEWLDDPSYDDGDDDDMVYDDDEVLSDEGDEEPLSSDAEEE
jgi:ubiquitin-conjugating enzyme E2 R